ncbi:MAG: YggU family protein [Syntrophaceae bacterium]|nr:YggU family protein [Syntrophaceae bacterium]
MNNIVNLKESKKGLTFDIQVTPNASRAGIAGEQDGALKLKVAAPPVEGAANDACIKLLASELKLKKSQMEIFSGSKSRKKTVMVKNLSRAELEKKIKDFLKANKSG